MGTWTLWIAFNAGVTLLLVLDVALFHRRAHEASLKEAALESAAWVALSLGFGVWIYLSHGRGPALEFFTGYLIEKSLSADNVFVFLLIFQAFRVEARYQHRLLFWGVLGALILRGAMIGTGVVLIESAGWILYLFGAFLVYSGFHFFRSGGLATPGENPIAQRRIVRWASKFLSISDQDAGPNFFVREGGRLMATRMFLAVVVLETADVVFAADSIPAIFGVTHDAFLVYSSNVCAILGLRALYFLLAGVLPYFRYLDEGLAVVLIFIGGKMLAVPWIHIPTGISLAVVGSVIATSILVSILSGPKAMDSQSTAASHGEGKREGRMLPAVTPDYIHQLANHDAEKRSQTASDLSAHGSLRTLNWLDAWKKDSEFAALIVQDEFDQPPGTKTSSPRLTTGIAVLSETFEKIRAANGSPLLADVPPDQDAVEFELHFDGQSGPPVRLDVLTTKAPGGPGAIARFLDKFGEGIQQIELDVTNVDRATEILGARFQIQPIYPATRPGANGTRVNFFLVPAADGKKVLVELVEASKDRNSH